MPLPFKAVHASWVLVTAGAVSDIVHHPDVREAAGAPATKAFQLGDVAAADYPDVHVSVLQRAPERFSISVVQPGAPEPGRPLVLTARAAFKVALAQRRPVALGLNFSRRGAAPSGDAGAYLLGLLGPLASTADKATDGVLTGAGVKLLYTVEGWHATLTLEPAVGQPREVVASVNYHREPLDSGLSGEALDAIVDQGPTARLYASFAHTVDIVLGEGAHVAIH